MKTQKKNKIYYTYKIKCLCGSENGCYYLGKRTSYSINEDYTGSGVRIKNYFNKYGKIEGKTYIKEICGLYTSKEELNKAEKELIGDLWKTDDKCLNLKAGGDGGAIEGHTVSEETRKKISEANKGGHPKGHTVSEETRKKISESSKGKKMSEEARKKMSEAQKGNTKRRGKHHSEEARKKMSEGHKGLTTWMKGKHHSDESRKKMSISMKGRTPWNKGIKIKQTA